MILRRVGAIAALMALATLTVGAQVPARDARTMQAPPPTGTAELSVVVSSDDAQGQPLRRVSVSIQQGELDVPHIGVTDDEGRVVFRNLVAGNYLLTAMRQGYVRTFYGSPLPGRGPGVAVTVLDGQRVAGVRIRMLRGSVITGVVRNPSGRPAANQTVRAILVRSGGGERRAIDPEVTFSGDGGLGIVSTDDRGAYRIFGLAPGSYLISVPSIGFGTQEVRPMTAAELAWADRVVAGAAGAATTAAPNVAPAPPGAPTVAFAPVYYPGTSIAADATVITLGPNEERAGLDFSLQLVPTARVRGRVVDTDGRPQPNLSVSIRPTRADGLDLFSSLLNGSGRTGPDGVFTVEGVKPGGYTLTVKATPTAGAESSAASAGSPEAARQAAFAALTGGGGGGSTHWASEDLVVQGRDVSDITLTLRPGMTITGKVVYDAKIKTPPEDITRTGLALLPAPTGTNLNDMAVAIGGGGSMTAKVEKDGSFVIQGIAPGKYRLNTPFAMMALPGLSPTAGSWTLKGVMANGRDISDATIEIKPGANVSGVVATFTDSPSELSGTVYDGAGRVTPNFPIIVFSTDRAYWTIGSRRVQQARPASDGKYKVTGLPAGEYFVCAVTAVERTEVYDPAFLEQLVGVSFKITVADGEKKAQDLKLGGG